MSEAFEHLRATRDVYVHNSKKLAEIGSLSISNEMRRATLMDLVLGDEPLCEMLAGRIHQISHGTQRK